MIKGSDELTHGEVKINGVIWSAYNQDEKTPLNEGELVEVLGINGNKLIVKKVN